MVYSSKLFNLKNKKIILTGCFGLLGVEFSDYLLKNGAIVIGIDLKFKKKFSKHNRFFFYKTDLSKPESIKKTCDKINKKYQKIDSLINNAAVNETIDKNFKNNFLNFNLLEFDKFSDVNIKAILYLSKYLHKILKKGNGGSIINIGSIYGVTAPDYSLYESEEIGNPAAYSSSKGGLIQFTKWLSTTLAHEIRVNCISPGGILRDQSSTFISKYEQKTPLKRMAHEEDFKGIIAYLASDLSEYVTGQNIMIDGGWTVW